MSQIVRAIANIGPLLVLSVLVIDTVLLSMNLRTIALSNDLVEETRATIAGLERTLSLLKDAETGQRGFLLTGREEYLEPYRFAETDLGESLDHLRFLASDDPAQVGLIDILDHLAGEKMAELRQSIALGRERDLEASREVVLTDRGRILMVEARRVVADLRDGEDRVLSMRTEASRSAVQWTIATATLTTGLALGLLNSLARSWDEPILSVL